MKYLIVSTVLIVVINLICARPAEDKYTTKYDNIDYKSILNSKRLLSNYMRCLLEGEKCTPAAKELRDYLPDALKTECAKCNEHQKKIGKEITDFMLKNKPTEFRQLEEKYDPEGIYRKRYEERTKTSE